MNRLEKLNLFKNKGFTYNKITGDIYGINGGIITYRTVHGYIQCRTLLDEKIITIPAHQLAWYLEHKEVADVIDHINGIKDDNRIINLRNVDHQKNNFNKRKYKGIDVKGYTWSKRHKKWAAQISYSTYKPNHKHLGFFDNELDAHEAYLDAKKIYHII